MQTMSSVFALAGIAGTSFTLALSGALMPGPLLTVTVTESARRGVRAGPLVITGHAILELLLVVAVIKGLGPILKIPPVIGTISLLGGIILLAMGIDMVRKASTLSLQQEAVPKGRKVFGHPLILGFVASLANPYWIIWWVTIGLGYLTTAGHLGLPGILAFFLGHITADYGWYILIALGVSRGKSIAPDRGYQVLIRCCGLFLVGFGCWFLTSAYGYFARA
jgi:threonine/homoserine/homoserine lactone efflux protein